MVMQVRLPINICVCISIISEITRLTSSIGGEVIIDKWKKLRYNKPY